MTDLRDERGFEALFERHRRELRVHCYRMLGSLEDAEDMVQETFLRAWRNRAAFKPDGPSSFRAWVYKIATNACLDALRGRPRRVLPPEVGRGRGPECAAGGAGGPAVAAAVSRPAPGAGRPARGGTREPRSSRRETIELAFLAAIQHLPPRQRAVFILRDVVGWSAKETAALIDASVASVNSALQRARATLQDRAARAADRVGPGSGLSEEERELLRRYVDAHERTDTEAFAGLLREDARLTMPPHPTWYEGREAIVIAAAQGFDPEFGRLRTRRRRRQRPAWGRPLPARPRRLRVPAAGA